MDVVSSHLYTRLIFTRDSKAAFCRCPHFPRLLANAINHPHIAQPATKRARSSHHPPRTMHKRHYYSLSVCVCMCVLVHMCMRVREKKPLRNNEGTRRDADKTPLTSRRRRSCVRSYHIREIVIRDVRCVVLFYFIFMYADGWWCDDLRSGETNEQKRFTGMVESWLRYYV